MCMAFKTIYCLTEWITSGSSSEISLASAIGFAGSNPTSADFVRNLMRVGGFLKACSDFLHP